MWWKLGKCVRYRIGYFLCVCIAYKLRRLYLCWNIWSLWKSFPFQMRCGNKITCIRLSVEWVSGLVIRGKNVYSTRVNAKKINDRVYGRSVCVCFYVCATATLNRLFLFNVVTWVTEFYLCIHMWMCICVQSHAKHSICCYCCYCCYSLYIFILNSLFQCIQCIHSFGRNRALAPFNMPLRPYSNTIKYICYRNWIPW